MYLAPPIPKGEATSIEQIREKVAERISKRGLEYADDILLQCCRFEQLTDESPFAKAFSAALDSLGGLGGAETQDGMCPEEMLETARGRYGYDKRDQSEKRWWFESPE